MLKKTKEFNISLKNPTKAQVLEVTPNFQLAEHLEVIQKVFARARIVSHKATFAKRQAPTYVSKDPMLF